MTEFEMLACQHLDAYIEAGEISRASSQAIRVLFRIARERDKLLTEIEDLVRVREAFKSENLKLNYRVGNAYRMCCELMEPDAYKIFRDSQDKIEEALK